MATEAEEGAPSALETIISILSKAEKVWEQRLLSSNATQNVETKLTVERQYKNGLDGSESKATAKEETIDIHRYVTQPAMVGCEMGATVNMGNYESARVLVSVTVPCYREEVPEAYAWAKNFVEERFKKEIAEARSVQTAKPKEVF